jgi:hypothetical protein
MKRTCRPLCGLQAGAASREDEDRLLQGCEPARRFLEPIGIGFAAQIQRSSLTGSYVMETAEHRESRGSGTVLGAPGGEIPPGDSTFAPFPRCPR